MILSIKLYFTILAFCLFFSHLDSTDRRTMVHGHGNRRPLFRLRWVSPGGDRSGVYLITKQQHDERMRCGLSIPKRYREIKTYAFSSLCWKPKVKPWVKKQMERDVVNTYHVSCTSGYSYSRKAKSQCQKQKIRWISVENDFSLWFGLKIVYWDLLETVANCIFCA